MPNTKDKGEIVLKYLEKYPNHPNLTIAKALHKDYPEIFRDSEQARQSVRYYRGASGKNNRNKLKDKTYVRPKGKVGWKFPLPPSWSNEWVPFELDYPKTLVLSDIHVPFHDVSAVEAAVKFGRRYKPKLLLLNGDIHDCYALSKWLKDPTLRNFPDEIEMLKQFFAYIKERLNCDIVWKVGNHEKRYEHYMFTRAPDLVGTDLWEYSKLIDAENLGIQIVKDERIIKLGRLPIVHGHEFSRNTYNPVNPARGLFLRGIHTALTGHWHQTSDHNERTMLGKVITTWSTGCLCDLHPQYAPINKWNHGFAIVELGKEDYFSVTNKRISDGEVL